MLRKVLNVFFTLLLVASLIPLTVAAAPPGDTVRIEQSKPGASGTLWSSIHNYISAGMNKPISISVTPDYEDSVAVTDGTASNTTQGGNYTVTAKLESTKTLTISHNGNGTTSPPSGTHNYAEGTVVNIVATPLPGYVFFSWAGDDHAVADDFSANTTITMDADYVISTSFFRLDLTVHSTAGGSVTVPGEGVYSCNYRSVVPLVATPAPGYWFTYWTGDIVRIADEYSGNTTITMYGTSAITANFAEEQTLTLGSTTGGNVSAPGEGVFNYPPGTVVNLIATPADGYSFTHWSGDVSAVADVYAANTNVTLFNSHNVIANFASSTLAVNSVTPLVNAVSVPADANICMGFDSAVSGLSINAENLRVNGSLTGLIPGNFSGGGTADITFNPMSDFQPGETVTVMLTWDIQSTAGAFLTAPVEWQFIVATRSFSGSFTDSGQTPGNVDSRGVAFGDLDGDGDLDVFVANYRLGNQIWLNDGSGTLSDSGQSLGNYNSMDVTLGDLDGDGDLDAFIANWSEPNRIWVNDGSGVFSDSGQSLGDALSHDVALGDLDGDGDVDAFIANTGMQTNKVWFNDGSGNFADSGQELGRDMSTLAIALGDLDGDGDLDAFITVSGSNGGIEVRLNNGSGYFVKTDQDFGASNNGRAVALGDLDGDGDLDAFMVRTASRPNWVWLNDGSGSFSVSGQIILGAYGRDIALGDVDGDGDLDTFMAFQDAANKLWLNNGTGSFEESGFAYGNSDSYDLAIGDLDADGDLDIFVANQVGGNKVWLWDSNTLSLSSTTGGNVTTPGEGAFRYVPGTVVSLVATPDQGYSFVNWAGNVATVADVNAASTSVTMSGNYTVTANFAQNQVTGPVDLVLLPASQTVGQSDNFTVTIQAQANGQEVSGISAFLDFDPNYFQVASITAGDTLTVPLQNVYDNTAGTLDYSAGVFSNFPTGTFTVATVTFNTSATTTGNTTISFHTSGSRTTDADLGGSSKLNSTTGAAVELVSGINVDISVVLQGGGRPDAGWIVPATIKFFTPGTTDVLTATPLYQFSVNTTKSGGNATCTVPGIQPGTYDVTVVSPHNLLNVKRNVVIPGSGDTVDMGTLLEGDTNDDGIINISDFGILAVSFMKSTGEQGWDIRADFDRNGIVNIADFGLLAVNFMQYSPITVTPSPAELEIISVSTINADEPAHLVVKTYPEAHVLTWWTLPVTGTRTTRPVDRWRQADANGLISWVFTLSKRTSKGEGRMEFYITTSTDPDYLLYVQENRLDQLYPNLAAEIQRFQNGEIAQIVVDEWTTLKMFPFTVANGL
jgi:hypothetical protein